MRPIALIVAALLLCVVCSSANARPRHHSNSQVTLTSCSDPVMRPCTGMIPLEVFGEEIGRKPLRGRHFLVVSRSKEITHHNTNRVTRMSPGLARVMAEGAGRAVNWIKPRAWCGWFMRREFGVANPAGNLARWWAGYGRDAHGPAVGAIVVWRHHVGKITGRTADGQWIVRSGNDGHRVRERPRSVAGAIAFRWPA